MRAAPRSRHAVLALVAAVTLVFPSAAAASTTELWAWGRNGSSQLGDETTTDRASPTSIAGGALQSVAAGDSHTCGLNAAGEAFCWGDNSYGQLGDGTTTNRTARTRVLGGLSFTEIAAGNGFTCAVASAGEAYCWGGGDYGRLGNGDTNPRTTPTRVSGDLIFSSVGVGLNSACGLTTAGAAYCWGQNNESQLGDGTTTNRSTPVAVGGGNTFTQLSVGGAFSCGLTSAGAAYCWGQNNEAQLGDGTRTNRSTPVAVGGGLTFASITTGGAHACGLTAAGAGYCWGSNGSGRLGIGSGDAYRTAPVAISGSLPLASISAGADHACGVTTSGAGYCWGLNNSGQLGDGTTTNRNTPTAVSGGITFAALITGPRANSTFGLPPFAAAATGDPRQIPTASMQQFVRPVKGDCSAAPAEFTDFPGLSDLRDAGWGQSWAQWPNGGAGGFVCSRQPYYTSAGTWSVR